MIVLICSLLFIAVTYEKKSDIVNQPYEVNVSTPEIICETEKISNENDTFQILGGTQKRLIVTISIDNMTNLKYKNTWFELELNKEMKPYIASQIIKYTSGEKMDVTTSDEAKISDKNVNSKPMISGFEHEWGLLLLTEDELKEYFDLSPEGICDALKEITVRIYWDGGKEIIRKPLSLSFNSMLKKEQ